MWPEAIDDLGKVLLLCAVVVVIATMGATIGVQYLAHHIHLSIVWK